MAKKKYSDSYMEKLWREAVYSEWGKRCALCGERDGLEIHHIISRRRRLLTYARVNGIPLCKRCHRMAGTNTGREMIADQIGTTDWNILKIVEQMNMKDFLQEECMTKEEYYQSCVDSLKRFISGEYVSQNLWDI